MSAPHSLRSLRHLFLFGLLLLLLALVTLPPTTSATAVPPGGPTPIRPLDYTITITGTHAIGEVITFTHPLGPSPAGLHPVWVYSEDGDTRWGVGRYAKAFRNLAQPLPIFGTGEDGDLGVPAGSTLYTDDVRTYLMTTHFAGQTAIGVANISGFNVGDEVLVIQMTMTGEAAGTYELRRVVQVNLDNLALDSGLINTYYVDLANRERAQVLRVPNYNDVTVGTNGILTAHAWDGLTGGIVAFKARGTVTINGQLTASTIGFRGGRRGDTTSSPIRHGYQGESYFGLGSGTTLANFGGGGGGQGDLDGMSTGKDVGAGGGGGGYGTVGTNGQTVTVEQGGAGGSTYGTSEISRVPLGSGGGGGGGDENDACYGGTGGTGAGSILVSASQWLVNNSVVAHGANGTRGNPFPNSPDAFGFTCRTGGGGGGSGGSIKVLADVATIGDNRVQANAGTGGPGSNLGGAGGAGGQGRIRLESCTPVTGTTSPTASTALLDCFLIEQVESDPYSISRLILPESFTTSRSYSVQYGLRLLYESGATLSTQVRVPAGAYTNATLDVLVSDFTGGDITLEVDIGDDGTWDWTYTDPLSVPTVVSSIDLAPAFTAYWVSQGSPPTGTLDVPVAVAFSRGGQLLVANLEMVPVGPTPTPTRTPSSTATRTPTPTITNTPPPGATLTPTPTQTRTPTVTNTPPPGATLTPTPTQTRTPTVTNTPPPGATLTPTQTPSDGEVYIPLVLRQYAFATPPPITPTPTFTNTPIPTCEVLDHEPNNFFVQANANLPLCEGATVTGVVAVNDIDDFYRVQVDNAATVRIDLTGIPIGADYDLYLYDASGGSVTVSANPGSSGETIRVPLSSGRYYIRVYSLHYADPNTYQLRWARE